MKKLLAFLLLCVSVATHAQFVPGQLLTAAELNTQFALYAPLAGATFTGPVTIPTINSGANATTQGFLDNSTLLATDFFVKRSILAATAAIPITNFTGGTYNFATTGTGASFAVLTSGGAISSVITVVSGGSGGYQVGDCLIMVGGNGDALLRVTGVSGGAVTSASILYGGTGYVGSLQLSGIPLPPGARTGLLSGTLTSNALIIIPAGTYLQGGRRIAFANNTTGAFTTTVKLSNGSGGSTGTGVVLPQGTANSTSILLYTDGQNDVWPEVSVAAIGSIPLSSLQTQAANTVVGNATGSTASPTAITVTGCNGAAQALQWTNGSGFGCNSTIATSGANANITSLSGLSTALSVAQGGTGRATLTTHGVLVGEGTSAINQLTAGTTGQVLVGSTGADPAFGTSVAGLTFTSAITPQSTGGIVGTTTNDSANAGSVGELLTNAATATSLSTGATSNCTSVSLTAGDWDVSGTVTFVPAGSTSESAYNAGISTTSVTFPAANTGASTGFTQSAAVLPGGAILQVSSVRVSIASTTTVYLLGNATFTVSTMTCNGFIRARRIR
jgi:hypothetical protein